MARRISREIPMALLVQQTQIPEWRQFTAQRNNPEPEHPTTRPSQGGMTVAND